MTGEPMSTALEERTSCEVCGSADQRLLLALGKFARGQGKGIVRCRRCGLVYRNVHRDEAALHQHYGKSEYAELSGEWIAGRRHVFLKYLEALEDLRAANRILDVGAGPGFFLSACAARGWECYGVDISSRAADFARTHFGLNVSCSSLEEARYPANFFDVVTFWNVLDELPSPKAVLREAHRILRPGGGVIVRVPNADFHIPVRRFIWRHRAVSFIFGGVDPTVVHLFSFSQKNLKRLLAESGFTDIATICASLSWTTTRDAGESIGRRFFAWAVQQFAVLLFILSRGRLLVSPSMLSTAKKQWVEP